jgi:hypothetical protein
MRLLISTKKRATADIRLAMPTQKYPEFAPEQIVAMDAALSQLKTQSNRPVAIFLGAGASKSFGYPLTRDLMFQIFRDLQRGRLLSRHNSAPRQKLLKFLTELLPGERTSKNEVPMVTGVLSLLDFAIATGQALLPGRTLVETRRARSLLERAIVEIFADFIDFSANEARDFQNFCSWVGHLKTCRPDGGLGFITTNYDMLSDVAAMQIAEVSRKGRRWNLPDLARKVDFGFRWVRPDLEDETFVSRPAAPEVSLLKLHGSTNWLRCPLCENVYINPQGPIAWIAAYERTSSSNQCHCSGTRLEAQIVSPSFVREMREPNLVSVWKRTLEFLRESDHWIVIGYSFPDEDVGIRALFTRAFNSSSRRPVITVVQLSEEARLNYESFFPSGSVRYVTGGLNLLLQRWSALSRNKLPHHV